MVGDRREMAGENTHGTRRAAHCAAARGDSGGAVPIVGRRRAGDLQSVTRHHALCFTGPLRGGMPHAHLHRRVVERHRGRRLERPNRSAGEEMKSSPLYPPSLTVGIEEEYQIVDPESGLLLDGIDKIMKSD